jgi:hypothetical protein
VHLQGKRIVQTRRAITRQALPGDGSKAHNPRQWRERIAVHHTDAASAGRLAGPDRDLARRVDPVQGDADGA